MLKKSNLKSLKLLKKVRTLAFGNVLVGLIKKNLKLLLRSKSSALIVLLGPLLIIGLVGAAFNTTNFYNINVGVYTGEYNELTLSVLDELEDKNFNVMKIESKEKCISKIKRSELHVCAVFPNDMQIGSEEGVVFFVDKTRMNIVWVIIDSISSKVSAKTSELSKELTNVLLSTLSETRGLIKERQGSVVGAIESNMELDTKIGESTTVLKELDLEYSTSDLGLGAVKSELTSAISSVGATQDDFSDVYEAIVDVENKSYGVSSKFNDARGKVSEILGSLTTLGGEVKISVDTMHQVAAIMASIMGKINTIAVTEAESIVTPIKTTIEPIIAEKTHLSNMFPTLLVLVIMFIGILLSSTLVVREKTSSSYFRNFITPTSDGMFMMGDFLTNLFVLFLQMAVIFLVSLIFFKEALSSVWFNSTFVILLIVSVFVFLGMFIGNIFSSEETNTLGAISVGSILLFFSSTILPLETLPATIRSVANLNPFVIGESMLKEIMLFNADLFVVFEGIVILLVYILILCFLTFGLRKLSKRFI